MKTEKLQKINKKLKIKNKKLLPTSPCTIGCLVVFDHLKRITLTSPFKSLTHLRSLPFKLPTRYKNASLTLRNNQTINIPQLCCLVF